MYFINHRNRINLQGAWLHLLPAMAVLVTMLALTFLTWSNAQEALRTERGVVSENISNDIVNRINEQLKSYEILLTAGSGLFSSSDTVTAAEWTEFAEGFRLNEQIPGVTRLGYAKYVPGSDLPAFIKNAGDTLNPDYRTQLQKSNQKEYALIHYNYPENKEVHGYDFFTDPQRVNAVREAQETGRPVLTGKVTMLRNVPGFSMFMPVYQNGRKNQPPENRQIQGFVYASIGTKPFFEQLLNNVSTEPDKYHMKLYDGQISHDNLIYDTASDKQFSGENSFKYQQEFDIYQHRWVVTFDIMPSVIAKTTRDRPLNALIAGFLLSPLLAGFVLTLLVSRTRALANAQRAEVNDAKDELLSLASHQLRTPATSVKQYLGMLKEGFVGTLTPQQENILLRAYDSNERQLHIINELLYVAKIDAKGIVLTPQKINLNKLIRSQAEELAASAKKRGQKIRVYLPKKAVFVEADEHCIRMAVENLISNALKYSGENTTTTIKLAPKANFAEISVKDHGIGISADEIPLLFQRFSRIPNEFSQQISGSGIGLYLSQQLVNLHGGSISVDSAKGKGTTFTIHLPKEYIH